jgi:uncharacterized membrane protein YqaE (UPF0057 family)
LLYNILTGLGPIIQTKQGESSMDNKVVQIILAIVIPPLAVYLKEGKIGTNFWINLVLWLLTWIGGIIHGLYVVLK